MTTCAESQQAEAWSDGGYIDWFKVHRFLWSQLSQLESMDRRNRANQSVLLLTCLEMLFGSDVLAPSSYPASRSSFPVGARFEDEDLLKLLSWVVEGQEGQITGPSGLRSGDSGWWFSTTSSGVTDRRHYLAPSADAWATLRRNSVGLEMLAQIGTAPTPLENKVFSSNLVVTGSGGLVDIQRWMIALAEAGAVFPSASNLPQPAPQVPSLQDFPNFWGEWIGAIVLMQTLSDTAAQLGTQIGQTFGPIGPSVPLGASLISAFRAWQQRRNQPTPWSLSGGLVYSLPGPLIFIANEAMDKAPAATAASWIPPTGSAFSVGPFSVVDPVVGQDWDSSIHQATRAVLCMHHMGAGLSGPERLVLLVRLFQWGRTLSGAVQQPCENYPPGACSAAWSTAPDFWVPRETDVWRPALACDGETGAPRLSQAPDLVDLLSAGLIVVRARLYENYPGPVFRGALDTLLSNCLIATAGLYRDDPSTELAGWAKADASSPTAPSAPPDLGGTMAAIALLLLLEGRVFPGVANLGTLPQPTAALVSLDTFLHVFGDPIPSLLASNPWNPSHVPG